MQKDIRDIFFNNIKKRFLLDKNFYILTNDADVHALRSLRKNNRFIDVGVAEQNLINVASGLCNNNGKSLVYGFCTFLTFRCYEQIKFNLASHKVNCKIVGIGPGYSFPYDGPTHHGVQDLYLMYLIPEMEVFNIADNNLSNQISKNINKINGPTYIRLDKGNMNYNNKIKYSISDGFNIVFKNSKAKVLIISSGYMCNLAVNEAKNNKNVSVLNLFKFKNINEGKLLRIIKNYKKIIIYDECTYWGGFTPIVSSLLIKNKLKINLNILSSPDKQLFKYSQNRDEIHEYLKISPKYLRKLF